MLIGFYNVIFLMDGIQNMPTLSDLTGWSERIVERQSYKYPCLIPLIMFYEISCAMTKYNSLCSWLSGMASVTKQEMFHLSKDESQSGFMNLSELQC